MSKLQSLADYLGVLDDSRADGSFEPVERRLEDISDPKEFAQAVLNSREFRCYIVNALTLGNVAGFSSILLRVMDLAGWQKPPERIEHTGKDGQPIETITAVRRVIVGPRDVLDETLDDEQRVKVKKSVTH